MSPSCLMQYTTLPVVTRMILYYARLKDSQRKNWRAILSAAAWRCKDPLQNNAIKHCGAVLSNLRHPFLYSFAMEEETFMECQGVPDFQFWWCPIGQCIRDTNHCQGQCPWGYEFDRYEGNCKVLVCLDHQRICDNSCIVETRSCHGTCPKGLYFCHEDGWCRDPRVPCGSNRTCPEDRHYCPRSNICQPNSHTCGYRTCLAPGFKYCYSSDTCRPLDSSNCVEWCPSKERLCGDTCVKMTEPCEGSCATGFWLCPASSSLFCIPRFRHCQGMCHQEDEVCLDEIERVVCFPKKTCPFPITQRISTRSTALLTTVTTTTATTASTSSSSSSPTTRETSTDIQVVSLSPSGSFSCPEQTCFPPDCPSPPCAWTCIGRNQSCFGICAEGRTLCGGVCLQRAQGRKRERNRVARGSGTVLFYYKKNS